MKLLALLLLCAFAAAAPNLEKVNVSPISSTAVSGPESRNILVNALIRQLFAYIRNVIANGSSLFDLPPLDPIHLDHFHLLLPLGIINLDLELKNIVGSGIGSFVIHRSHLDLSDLSFDLDISVPEIRVKCELYNLDGDILTAIPLYGNGKAEFAADNFRLFGKIMLKQSDDGDSIIIDKIVDAGFEIPHFSSAITGAIGGGDIDKIVNAVIEDVVIGYVRRFQGAVVNLTTNLIVNHGNPILEQLDTWRFIAPLL